MIHPTHPMALPIALLIHAEQKNHTVFEYAIYEVLNTYMEVRGWPEEKRADLYAQLAEKMPPNLGMIQKEDVINTCLWNTERKFNG
jgi:hypothetical protein